MRSTGWTPRLVLGGGAALVALGVACAFPVFFRADDAIYLQWVATHPNPFDAFVPSRATVFGVFRPLQNLVWWVLYRCFALAPLPYQLLVTLLLLACLVLLGTLAGLLFTPSAGWWAMAAYVVFFPYLLSVAFWFSDLSFLLETFLILATVILIAHALRGGVAFAWGVAGYVLAVLAKEPAAFIVPTAAAALVLAEWPALAAQQRRRGATVAAGLLVAAVLVALFHPSLRPRQLGVDAGLMTLIEAMRARWQAYSVHLMRGAGPGLVAMAVCAVWGAWRPRPWSGRLAPVIVLTGALAAALLLRPAPSYGVAVMTAGLLGLIVLRRREGAGAAWFLVPFAGLLTVRFVVRTYLFEAAFGLALVTGPVLAELGAEVWRRARRAPRAAVAVGVVILAVGIAVFGPGAVAGVRSRLAALAAVSEARLDFRDAVAALGSSAARGERVAVVDYADMGLDYVRDILPLPDLAKAHRQKTMVGPELALFLAVAGRPDLRVMSSSELLRLPARSEALLLVMNRAEDAFAAGLPLTRRLLFEAARGGEAARVYRVRANPG